ncbi:MAG TPA: GatB/YqeY domain-containing protein [Chitinophagaceae bacterium]|nr:GatB/YqeY domain-containing protein [Chitinophagaceae bacterium]HQU56047.1 GatB/YqeY domain-containing protein [Chitinophagaceae bacterium]
MSVEPQIVKALKEAMIAKDEASLRSLRAIKAAFMEAKTAAGAKGQLSADDEMKILQKLVKQRKDSLSIYTEQKRDDLATKEKEEIEVIEKFLPQQMTAEEIKTVVQKIINDLGASSMADMGKVMGIATKQLLGKADGKEISTQVRTLLSGQD